MSAEHQIDHAPLNWLSRARRRRRAGGRRARRRRGSPQRIAAEELADVSYATVDSPFGTLLVASTPRGLVRLAFPEESVDAVLERLAARVSPRIVEARAPLDPVAARARRVLRGRAPAASRSRSTGR